MSKTKQQLVPVAAAHQWIFEVFFGSTVAIMLFDAFTGGSWRHIVGSGVVVVLGAGAMPRLMRWWDGLWSRHAT